MQHGIRSIHYRKVVVGPIDAYSGGGSVLGVVDMALNIFLSLSYVDAPFVRTVRERLPSGLARIYERSFERGADVIGAMETSLDASEVFVLFASRTALDSYAWSVRISVCEAWSVSPTIG